jgi:UDP-N-acetylglucosamine 2-epimerase (non-hydrolysing)
VLVVGDVNSTLACALVAVKKGVPVVHVEAGLRSGDRAMPEEINRMLTDQISDRLYTTERSALANLVARRHRRARVCFAGNVMIDSLLPAARWRPQRRDTCWRCTASIRRSSTTRRLRRGDAAPPVQRR